METKKYLAQISLIICMLLILHGTAYSSAMSAHTGQWYGEEVVLSDSFGHGQEIKQELDRINYADTANSGGDFGPYGSFSWSYKLNISRNRKSAIWHFADIAGETGILYLTPRGPVEEFRTDIHDGIIWGAGGPALYKEIRIFGSASGEGVFSIINDTDATFGLILKGRGNNQICAEDFLNWHLYIETPTVYFYFYGDLNDPQERGPYGIGSRYDYDDF